MNKFIISLLITIVILWIGGTYLYISYEPEIQVQEKQTESNKWKKITLTTEEINPEEYETVNEFLNLLETKTEKMNVSVQDDFYISHSSWSSIEFIRVWSGELKNDFSTMTGTKKNEVIQDIFEAYKKQNIYAEKKAENEEWIRILKESELPNIMQVHNKILKVNPKESYKKIREELESKENRTNEEVEVLSYLYDYSWDYKKANMSRRALTWSIETARITVSGTVKDGTGSAISWARVEVLNNPEIYATSNSEWVYTLSFEYPAYSRVRLRATEKSHSDWFNALSIFDPLYNQVETKDFTLQKPDYIVEINLDTDVKNGIFTIETPQTTYTIPEDALVNADTTKSSQRKFRAYLYEFTKQTNMDNYMYNDTFDEVYGYVGNIMKTFGMPYMQIFDLEGNEVHIRKNNSAILTNRIYHMKELYENYDKIYTEVTDQDMNYLVEESKKWDFPITREWLIENNFLRWPAWWMLNRTKWVWESVGHRVIDSKWVIETIYYTID